MSSTKARCARGIRRTRAERGSFRSLPGVLWTFFKLVHALPLPFNRAASNSKQLGAIKHFSNRTTFDQFRAFASRVIWFSFDLQSRRPTSNVQANTDEEKWIEEGFGEENFPNAWARAYMCVCASEWEHRNANMEVCHPVANLEKCDTSEYERSKWLK